MSAEGAPAEVALAGTGSATPIESGASPNPPKSSDYWGWSTPCWVFLMIGSVGLGLWASYIGAVSFIGAYGVHMILSDPSAFIVTASCAGPRPEDEGRLVYLNCPGGTVQWTFLEDVVTNVVADGHRQDKDTALMRRVNGVDEEAATTVGRDLAPAAATPSKPYRVVVAWQRAGKLSHVSPHACGSVLADWVTHRSTSSTELQSLETLLSTRRLDNIHWVCGVGSMYLCGLLYTLMFVPNKGAAFAQQCVALIWMAAQLCDAVAVTWLTVAPERFSSAVSGLGVLCWVAAIIATYSLRRFRVDLLQASKVPLLESSTVPYGTVQAGTEQAGTEQAGTEQAGTEQAGTEQAGTEQAGDSEESAKVAA